jgi:hypothetical protein
VTEGRTKGAVEGVTVFGAEYETVLKPFGLGVYVAIREDLLVAGVICCPLWVTVLVGPEYEGPKKMKAGMIE